jgi:diadenosine tetraphosphatase ApaH/serine/threonine PP2A family protein phosphatase
MRYAIFSDLHDNTKGLDWVLVDAQQQQADRLVYLGDVGRNPKLFQRLHTLQPLCTFGNWEVSGYFKLASPLQQWVAAWPATQQVQQALFCHATPDVPPGTGTTWQAARTMRSSGMSWAQLFPRLDRDEEARWRAVAQLEASQMRVAFHGHTHVQMIWRWQATGEDVTPARRWRSTLPAQLAAAEFELAPGPASAPTRYLVGVGSAGQPQDGPQLRYVLYDEAAQTITLRAPAD